MGEIYVTGHRNPDTDSIVAAIAYANLRNSLGDREYKAVRIGAINDETQSVLDRFGFEAPPLVKNMRTQVCDLDFDRPPELNSSVTMDLAWRTMREGQIATMPIVNEDGSLYGMLSAGDIASYDMQTIYNSHIDELPLFNLISVLEGQLVNEFGNDVNTVSGEVRIALPQSFDDPMLMDKDTILICGDQPEIINAALEGGINCLIICQAEVRNEWVESESPTCIVYTPLDARKVARVIYQAIPIARVCEKKDIIAFHLADYVDDVREVLLKSRYRCYPILDENNHVVGTLSRFHLLRPRRKQVVLVDHNEAAQSVHGLDQVEIMEIIDHHRLADIQTRQPVSVRNEPVGSTNTIITAMYQENGVMPSPKIAGLMAAAILSDTVVFQSPTCTERDKVMAERMARIAGVSLQELGQDIFSVSMSPEQSAEELLHHDYKVYEIADHSLAVAQITGINSGALLARKQELLLTMEAERQAKGMDLELLMLTDVLRRGTELLAVGDTEEIGQALGARFIDNQAFLPGVMSRKKQIIPALSVMWG